MFSQDPWVAKRQKDYLREQGLIKTPYVHAGLKTSKKLEEAFLQPFSKEVRPEGGFDLVKHVSGGRRLNKYDVKSIKDCSSINSIKAFYANTIVPYIVPSAWRDRDDHSPARKNRDEAWWYEYCRMTEGLKSKRQRMLAEAKARGESVKEYKGKQVDDGESDDDYDRDPEKVWVRCFDCHDVYQLSKEERHLARCGGNAILLSDTDFDNTDSEEEMEARIFPGPSGDRKRKDTDPPRRRTEPTPFKTMRLQEIEDRKRRHSDSDNDDRDGSTPEPARRPHATGNAPVRHTAYAKRGSSRPSGNGRNTRAPVGVTMSVLSPVQGSSLSGDEEETNASGLGAGEQEGGGEMEVDEVPRGEVAPHASTQIVRTKSNGRSENSNEPDSARHIRNASNSVPRGTSTPRSVGLDDLQPPSAARRPRPRLVGASAPQPARVAPLTTDEKQDLKCQVDCLLNTIPASGAYLRRALNHFMAALDVYDRDKLPEYQELLRLTRNPEVVEPRGCTDSMIEVDSAQKGDAEAGGISARVASETLEPPAINQLQETGSAPPITSQSNIEVHPEVAAYIARTAPDLLAQEAQQAASHQVHTEEVVSNASDNAPASSVFFATPSLSGPTQTTSDNDAPPQTAALQPLTGTSSPLSDPDGAAAVPLNLPPVPVRRFTRATSAILGDGQPSGSVTSTIQGESLYLRGLTPC